MTEIMGLEVPTNEEAPKVLLMGQPGAGKTFSIATLLQAGLKVFVIFTEQGKDSLLEACLKLDLSHEEISNLHYARVGTSTPGWGGLKKFAKDVNQYDQSTLQKGGNAGAAPKSHQQMIEVIALCENFIDQNGEAFGNVSEFGNDSVLVFDGMSGINDMCMDLVVGAKPIKTQADWGIAMDAQIRFVKQCVNDLICGCVILCHLELNKDEVDQRIYRYPKILGNKNTYDFGKYFSDVILAKDTGTAYLWSTEENQMQLKSRNLDKSSKHKPTFVDLWKNWAGRFAALGKVEE